MLCHSALKPDALLFGPFLQGRIGRNAVAHSGIDQRGIRACRKNARVNTVVAGQRRGYRNTYFDLHARRHVYDQKAQQRRPRRFHALRAQPGKHLFP